MDEKLMKLSCPFTWEMESAIKSQNKLLGTKDDRLEMADDVKDDLPEHIFVYHLLLAYENVMSADLPSARQCIKEAEQCLDDIKKKANLETAVDKVLDHICIATKCHVLQKQGQLTGVDKLLKEILNVENMNEAQLAMLSGCQCHAWSFYYVQDNSKAIEYAQKAIELEPSNGKWYYLLGKNYRRLRKMQSIFKPTKEEISALKTAYNFSISKNALYGISLAQLHRESWDKAAANNMYNEVYALQPASCSIRLQLAIAFIRMSEPKLAENCLKYVGERMPDSVMYTHYMGIYEEVCNKNDKAALPYYRRTTERLNFGSEWQYMECSKRVEPDFDALPYLLGLVKKYENNADYIVQGIYIQIGFYYLNTKKDILSACQYLTKAIEIRPDDQQLQKYRPLFQGSSRPVNIYKTFIEAITFALRNGDARDDAEMYSVLNDTLRLCRTHFRR